MKPCYTVIKFKLELSMLLILGVSVPISCCPSWVMDVVCIHYEIQMSNNNSHNLRGLSNANTGYSGMTQSAVFAIVCMAMDAQQYQQSIC